MTRLLDLPWTGGLTGVPIALIIPTGAIRLRRLAPVWEIWTTVTDQHNSDASYAAIRDYIRSCRLQQLT